MANPTPATKPPSAVLERALLVLACFSEAHPRLQLRELAAHTGLDKATLLRILGTFITHGYLRREPDGRYAPGPAPLRLAALYGATHDLTARLTPILRAVMERTGESAAFYERNGDDRLCVCRVNAHRALRHQMETGERLPLSAGGAAAHVLLAGTGSPTPLAETLRRQGWLSTAGEHDPGLASIAIPVLDADNTFLGALVVSGPISRQSEEGFAEARAVVTSLLQEQGFRAVG